MGLYPAAPLEPSGRKRTVISDVGGGGGDDDDDLVVSQQVYLRAAAIPTNC